MTYPNDKTTFPALVYAMLSKHDDLNCFVQINAIFFIIRTYLMSSVIWDVWAKTTFTLRIIWILVSKSQINK